MNRQMAQSLGRCHTGVSRNQPVCSFFSSWSPHSPPWLSTLPWFPSHSEDRWQSSGPLHSPQALHKLALSVLCPLLLTHSPPATLASPVLPTPQANSCLGGFAFALFLAWDSSPSDLPGLCRSCSDVTTSSERPPQPQGLNQHLCPSPSPTLLQVSNHDLTQLVYSLLLPFLPLSVPLFLIFPLFSLSFPFSVVCLTRM